MRRAALVLGAVAAVAAMGCGDDDESGVGELVWEKRPEVYRQPTLPRDRVLVGTVRNDSLRRMSLAAEDVRAVDGEGKALRGNATFVRGYLHPLYPPTRPPEGGLPEAELERLGRLVRLEPGKTTRLSVAWRVPPGGDAPARIDYGSGWLPVPAR